MDEKSNSSKLQEILGELTPDQMRFVVEMPNHSTKKSCAEALDISIQTVYNWGDIIDDAVTLFHQDIVRGALEIRKKNLAKAMMVKVAGLDEDNDALRQKVATEIIEWETGKALQKADITSNGEKMEIIVKYADDNGKPT